MLTPRTALIAMAFFTAVLVLVPAATRATESYDNCTGFIDSVPASITTQGTWCLRKDLGTSISSGYAITIDTNNVTLDCNDFKLDGLSAGPGTSAVGIGTFSRVNATVRGCNVRGFRYGVYLNGSGHTVEDSRLDGNTYVGIQVEGDGSLIQRNQVRDTGGCVSCPPYAFGIHAAHSTDIIDNAVSGVLAGPDEGGNGTSSGITTDGNINGSISGNRVSGVFGLGNGVVFGINNSNSGRVTLSDNHVVGDDSAGSIGLRCLNNNGRALNNTVNGFATGISGCRDDANSL